MVAGFLAGRNINTQSIVGGAAAGKPIFSILQIKTCSEQLLSTCFSKKEHPHLEKYFY